MSYSIFPAAKRATNVAIVEGFLLAGWPVRFIKLAHVYIYIIKVYLHHYKPISYLMLHLIAPAPKRITFFPQ
jgi:hypothetical protein